MQRYGFLPAKILLPNNLLVNNEGNAINLQDIQDEKQHCSGSSSWLFIYDLAVVQGKTLFFDIVIRLSRSLLRVTTVDTKCTGLYEVLVVVAVSSNRGFLSASRSITSVIPKKKPVQPHAEFSDVNYRCCLNLFWTWETRGKDDSEDMNLMEQCSLRQCVATRQDRFGGTEQR